MRPTPGWARAILVESIVGRGQEVQPIDLRCRQDIAVVGSSLLPRPLPVSTCAGWSSIIPNVVAGALVELRHQILRCASASRATSAADGSPALLPGAWVFAGFARALVRAVADQPTVSAVASRQGPGRTGTTSAPGR